MRRFGTRLTRVSDAVGEPGSSGHARAVGAAVEAAVRLDAVADHLASAVLAGRGERVDRALEAIECMRVAAGHPNLEGFVVPYTSYKHTHPHGRAYALEAVYWRSLLTLFCCRLPAPVPVGVLRSTAYAPECMLMRLRHMLW